MSGFDDAIEFDARLGTPGLHSVGRQVAATTRRTILPPAPVPPLRNRQLLARPGAEPEQRPRHLTAPWRDGPAGALSARISPRPSEPAMSVPADPFSFFAAWFADAEKSEVNDPNAMTLATVDARGQPHRPHRPAQGVGPGRLRLLFQQGKPQGRRPARQPHAPACCSTGRRLRRQVRIEGTVHDVTDAEADAYYNSRPRGSRVGAWASIQSRPLTDRATLEARVAEMEARYPGEDVPRPPDWSGWRLVPDRHRVLAGHAVPPA
jgi:pyridoxamine 5'-phosphate oxidase